MIYSTSCAHSRTKESMLFGFVAVVLIFVAAGFTGCASTRPMKYYQISVAPAPTVAAGKPHTVTLLIGRIECAPLLRDGRILYRVGPHEVNAYQYHRWVEAPDRVVQGLLLQVLRSSGKYRAVQEQEGIIGAGYVVRGKLFDFSEVDSSGIQARVSMEFDLYDRKSGGTVWTRYYTRDEPVEGKDVQDVVHCIERNLLKGLNEIAAGIDQYFGGRELEAADHKSGTTLSVASDGHH